MPRLLPAAVVVAAVALFLWPVVRGGFVSWDDEINITQNPYLSPPSLPNLAYLWLHAYKLLYVPLVYMSYVPDLLVGGGRPWPFHLTNLLLHAGSALVVMAILRLVLSRWLAGTDGTAARDDESVRVAAMCGALWFGLHPLQVEAVAWATGRKDVLAGLLALTAIWLHARNTHLCIAAPEATSATYGFRGPGRVRLASSVLATSVFVLSLLAKPLATIPLAALVLDLWVFRCPVRRALVRLAPWFVIAAAWTVLTLAVQPAPAAARDPSLVWARPLVAADALSHYVTRTVLPVGLATIYDRTIPGAARSPWSWVKLAGVGAACWLLFRRRSIWGAAGGVFLAGLLPVLGLVPFMYQKTSTVADRYAYVSMLGSAIAAGATVAIAWARRPAMRVWVGIGTAVVTCLLGLLSLRQTAFWKDSRALWERAVLIAPNSAVANSQLAAMLVGTQEQARGEALARRALASDPGNSDAHLNLGYVLQKRGEEDAAVAEFVLAAQFDPEKAKPHVNLGIIYRRRGQLEAAMREYETAARLDPRNAQARGNLGACYLEAGQYPRAEAELRAAVNLEPQSVLVRTNLAAVLAKQGRRDEAVTQLQEVLRIKPDHQPARTLLGELSSATEKAGSPSP